MQFTPEENRKSVDNVLDLYYNAAFIVHQSLRLVFVVLLLGLPGWVVPVEAQVSPEAEPIDISPEEVKKKEAVVQAPENFEFTLFAAPPEVNYPTAITATPEGDLFVAVDKNGSLGRELGRGKILKVMDTDDDGHADHYTTFVDSVDSPRGLVYDGEKLYVMHPPTLTVYTDTDGDGVSDTSKDLVENLGFGLDFRGADHTTNGMQMGIDGWLYIAVGDYGFINAEGTDGRQISHRGGGVVRVRPDGTGLELYAENLRNPYDVALDPFLNGYVRDNTNDGYRWRTRLQHIVPQANYGYPSKFHYFADEVMPPMADYGGGSGAGALYVDAPSLPDSLGNNLLTADWGRAAVYHHDLTEVGATFEPTQQVFFRIPQPTDLTIDGHSNLYVSSWMGGSFTYNGEDVGFIGRLTHEDAAPASGPDVENASPERLVEVLASGHSLLRLHAQRELLRRDPGEDVTNEIARLAREGDDREVRVAALFTLKQLEGPESHSTIVKLLDDPSMRAFALRALADRKAHNEPVSADPFVEALEDEDPRVRLQALNGLARLGAQEAAGEMISLVSDPDRTVAHVAVQSLVELDAVDPALTAVRNGSPGLIRGALQVLMRLHQAETVDGLSNILEETVDPFTRRQVIGGLARLYHREAEEWTTDDWWGTTPSPRGPYHEPIEWAESDRIRSLLHEALAESEGPEYRRRVQLIELNRAVPDGAGSVLLTASSDSLRSVAIETLLGAADVTDGMVPSLDSLAGHSLALRRATTDLLTAQRALPAASASMLGDAALEEGLGPTVRAEALRALDRASGDTALSQTTSIYTQLLAGTPPKPVSETIRWYVRQSQHREHVDHFVQLAQAESDPEKKLGYAVLLHIADNDDLDEEIRNTAEQVIEDGWSASNRTPSLLWAIGYTETEGYADQVRQHLESGNSQIREAAQYAARRLEL